MGIYPNADAPTGADFVAPVTPTPDDAGNSLSMMNFTVYFEPTAADLAARTIPLLQTLDASGDGEQYWIDVWNNELVVTAWTDADGAGSEVYRVALTKPLVADSIYRFQNWEPEVNFFEQSGDLGLLLADQWWTAKHDQSAASHHYHGELGPKHSESHTTIRLGNNVFQEFYRYRTRSTAWQGPDYRVAFYDTTATAYSADFYFLAGDSTEERAEAWVELEAPQGGAYNNIRGRTWQRTHNDDNLIQVIAHNSSGSTGGANQYLGTALASGDIKRIHIRNTFINTVDPYVQIFGQNYDGSTFGAPGGAGSLNESGSNVAAPWEGWTFSTQWIMPFRDGEDRYRTGVFSWSDFGPLTYTFTDYDNLPTEAVLRGFFGTDPVVNLTARAQVILGGVGGMKINKTIPPALADFTGTTTEPI